MYIILSQKFDQPNDDTSSPSSSIFFHNRICLKVASTTVTIGAMPVRHAHLPPLPRQPF